MLQEKGGIKIQDATLPPPTLPPATSRFLLFSSMRNECCEEAPIESELGVVERLGEFIKLDDSDTDMRLG